MRRIFLYLIRRIECFFNSGDCLSSCATIFVIFKQNGTEHHLDVAFSHLEYPIIIILKMFFPEFIALKNTGYGIVPVC